MADPATPPLRFSTALAASLHRAGATPPTGCYLHGSAALGGWHPDVSDVDLLLVVDDWSRQTRDAVTKTITDALSRCPGTGLELSVVHADAARAPGPPWPFLLHLDSTGDVPRFVDGASQPGDPDLALHYALTRAHGRAVAGPPPDAVFGEVPRAVLLRHLHDELDWGLAHAAEAYAVLNALRAIAFARDSVLLSKVAAGTAALRGTDVPVDLVRRALRSQQGDEPPRTPGADAEHVVRHAQSVLAVALANEHPSD